METHKQDVSETLNSTKHLTGLPICLIYDILLRLKKEEEEEEEL